jgi:hypothetical protein
MMMILWKSPTQLHPRTTRAEQDEEVERNDANTYGLNEWVHQTSLEVAAGLKGEQQGIRCQ